MTTNRARPLDPLALALALLAVIGPGCTWLPRSVDAGERDAGPEAREDARAPRDDGGGTDAGTIEAHFVDVTEASGLAIADGDGPREAPDCLLDDVRATTVLGDYCEAEHAIAGVAVGDVDGDGDPDLVITRIYGRAALYENQGDGTFVDASAENGFVVDQPTAGAAFADVDRDGDLDLYLTVFGGTRHLLFVREGDRYVERGVERGAALAGTVPLLGSSVQPMDFDRDGDLDLYVGEWRHRYAVHDGPSMARLLRNRGPAMPGFFEDVTDAAGVSMETAYGGVAARGVYVFGAVASDLDADGHEDLFVAGDFRTARAFWGRGDGTFLERTLEAGLGIESNAMGTTLGDYDGDGDLDLYVTSIRMPGGAETGNRLYRNDGARTFRDVSDVAGVPDGGWGWGTAFLDYDADGDLDLVATNGWTLPDWQSDPMRLYRNRGDGTFDEVAAAEGLADRGQGRGLAVLDLEGDGDLDLVIARYAAAPIVYRNERASERGWLRVRVRGAASAIDGTGVRVYVRATPAGPERMVEIGRTSSYLGQSERVAFFGLGDHAGPIDRVRVAFPSGSEATRSGVEPRTEIVVDE